MRNRKASTGAGQGQGVWPVLLLLLAAVVVPTACVLWFMSEAVRNERLAVRQKLADVYRPDLVTAADALAAHWEARAGALSEVEAERSPAQVFAQLVTGGVCDSAVVCDASGAVLYPAEASAPVRDLLEDTEEWAEASRIEHELPDPAAAAALFGQIGDEATDAALAARAFQAQARCLVRAGLNENALEVLTVTLAAEKYRDATDVCGRAIVPNAQLLALELMREPTDPGYLATLEALVEWLNDYGAPLLPSSQRRFIMRRLRELAPDCPAFPTLAAEELAAQYLAMEPPPPASSYLGRAPLPGVWRLPSDQNTVIALFGEDRLLNDMQSLIEANVSLPDVTVTVLPPGAEPERDPFLAVPAGQRLPDWRVALYLEGVNPFDVAADQQIAAYLWTGVLVVIVISIIALLVGRYLLRQIKFTRLKNDFIATVSHELKTPLSSMRVLVDTLLEGNYRDQQQAREYLELVARENVRLSRLIDNFLTFSRMERNKQAFEFTEVAPAEIVNAAAEVVRGRFESQGCRFDVEVADGLPGVTGDRDALVTVLLNLLDNAYKYSRNARHIALRAYASNGCVCLEVQDDGMGMSRRAVRKAFDRFYQVDTSLSRGAGGCGLGLSIVKFIVDAHGGAIEIKSQPGKGSTFAVRLPVAGMLTSGNQHGQRRSDDT